MTQLNRSKIDEELSKLNIPVAPEFKYTPDPLDELVINSGDSDTINLDDFTINPLDLSALSVLDFGNLTIGVGSGGSGGSLGNMAGASGYNYQNYQYNTTAPLYTNGSTFTINPSTPSNQVNITSKGIEMAEDADIIFGSRSMKKMFEAIEQRLAILVPNPTKLEQYEALRQAYEHYKTLEALCSEVPLPEKK